MVTAQPRLAAIAQQKLIGPGVLLMGTTRRDGSARISGVEPLVMDGDLWLSMMQRSTKALDLRRDPRIVLHSTVTGPEAGAEILVRGTAKRESNSDVQQRYAQLAATELGWQPVVGQFMLVVIAIDEVTYIDYDPDTGGQHVAIWPTGLEYLRPSITPTSLGPPQPVQRPLLD
ncbi:MAG: hypothetical protein ACR2P2_11305 [Nakamurella sp.]